MFKIIDNHAIHIHKKHKHLYKLSNKLDGTFQDNPDTMDCDPDIFYRVFSGHGEIIHLSDNPPNWSFVKPEQAFTNPELLPKGTTNVFLELVELDLD